MIRTNYDPLIQPARNTLGRPFLPSVANAACADSILDPGRSPGEENGNLIQYSCLGNTTTDEPDGLQSMSLTQVNNNKHIQLSFRVCLAFLQCVAPGSTIKEQRSVSVENVLETAQLQGNVGSSCTKMIRREKWRVELQIRSVAQSSPTLCDPMNRSTPGLLVHHQLLEFTQTHNCCIFTSNADPNLLELLSGSVMKLQFCASSESCFLLVTIVCNVIKILKYSLHISMP